MINVFLDDNRPAPQGYVPARTAQEAIRLLASRSIDILSLDHDLGTWPVTGYDVVVYMVSKRRYPRQIILHTANPLGRYRMLRLLRQHKPDRVKLTVSPLPLPF